MSNLLASDVIVACHKTFVCQDIRELFVSDNGSQYANIFFEDSHLSTD